MDALARLQVQSELTQLVASFSHCIDNRRYEQLADLFTPDGVFDRLGQALEGRQAILSAMAKRHPFLTRHCVMNLLFTRIDEDQAEATMLVANFVGQPNSEGLPVAHASQPALLEFDDIYRRTPDGWRIERRTARLIIKPDNSGH